MRVRCSFCSAEYDTPVTPAALVFVDRCEHCGRARLEPVEDCDPPEEREAEVSRLRHPPGER
ncbi:MAG TPA: hypothetical protein VE997_02450 [Candidatus Limnocylindria bacterium]|jgi:hypothetical protein|nr:hypothetical protein [Candidatus Limnocylindria bacterium]